MLANSFQIEIEGRGFSTSRLKASLLNEPYVWHENTKYPVLRGKYPIEVLASVSANESGQLVLFKLVDKVYVFQSNTKRSLALEFDTTGIFDRSINRLLLSSNAESAIVFTDEFDDCEFKITKKDISSIKLPNVIHPKNTAFVVTAYLVTITFAFVTSFLVVNSLKKDLDKEDTALEISQGEMIRLQEESRKNKDIIQKTKEASQQILNKNEIGVDVPERKQSFIDMFSENSKPYSLLKVENGSAKVIE